MLVLLFLLAALLAALVLLDHSSRLRTKVPGPLPLPLIGNALLGRNTAILFQSLNKAWKEYGNTFRFYIGNKLFVFICEPQDIQKVLCNSKITDRDHYYSDMVEKIAGDGILSSRGEKWRKNRKILAPTFHQQVVNHFLDIFNERASVLADVLAERCGEDIDIYSLVSVSAMETICESAMGSSIVTEDKELKVKFADLVSRLIQLLEERLTRPWLALDWIYALTSRGREQKKLGKNLNEFVGRLITRKMESGKASQPDNEGFKKFAFMDTMLLPGGQTLLPNNEIKNESIALITTGYETTALSLCFTLCLLAHHKNWQDAVHQELDEIFLRTGDNDRPLTLQDVADMRVLECVIKESLRLFPIVAFLPRHIPFEISLGSDKFTVPKGASVLVIHYFTHRLSEIFPNPHVFDPTRFFPEKCEGRHPNSYIPFGAGSRNCIGSRLYVGNKLFVFICEPQDIQKVLCNSQITDRDHHYSDMVRKIIGDGILSSLGEKWKKNRKILAPTFHQQVVNQFLDIFNERASVLADVFAERCGEDIDIHSLVCVCSMETICESAMGSSIVTKDKEQKVKFADLVSRLIQLLEERITRPWLALDGIYALTSRGREQKRLRKNLNEFVGPVITRKMESGKASQPDNEGFKRFAFMDTILLPGGQTLLPNNEIKNESMALITTGYETTAKSLCFTLCLLAHHKDWQDAVHQELDDIFLRTGDSERPLTLQDVADMRVLDCVIKESLRLFPVAPFCPRQLPFEISLGSDKFSVPKDASVFVIPYFTHRLSEIFPNPHVFDPTRFFPEKCEGRHPNNYIPFGAGSRNCIGSRYAMLQMKVTLTWILRRFRVVTATPREELENLEFSITMKPVNGFQAKLQHRKMPFTSLENNGHH